MVQGSRVGGVDCPGAGGESLEPVAAGHWSRWRHQWQALGTVRGTYLPFHFQAWEEWKEHSAEGPPLNWYLPGCGCRDDDITTIYGHRYVPLRPVLKLNSARAHFFSSSPPQLHCFCERCYSLLLRPAIDSVHTASCQALSADHRVHLELLPVSSCNQKLHRAPPPLPHLETEQPSSGPAKTTSARAKHPVSVPSVMAVTCS